MSGEKLKSRSFNKAICSTFRFVAHKVMTAMVSAFVMWQLSN